MSDDFLIIIFLIIMRKSNDNKGFSLNSIRLDKKHTVHKIRMLKEIGPYLPQNYIPLVNKSISFTNKFIKINEVSNFLYREEEIHISNHIPMKGEERVKKIMSLLHNESEVFKQGQMGQIMDLILNMDKYKKTFQVLNKVMGNPNSLNDPSQLINLIGPLMGSNEEGSSSKIKEMTKMMELIKLLDTPKKANK